MQQLDHNEMQKLYDLKQFNRDMPIEAPKTEAPKIVPVGVEVQEDFLHEAVLVKFGGQELHMTIQGARDLAFEIRKAANTVEKNMLDRGAVTSKQKKHKRH